MYSRARTRAGCSGSGISTAAKLGEITEEHFDAIFGLNTRGTLFTVQKALPLFNDGGSIFMTRSIASVKGWPDYSAYSASKAALRSFARTWLSELKDRGIRVNVLSPGQVSTPIQDEMFDPETKAQFEALIRATQRLAWRRAAPRQQRLRGTERADREGGVALGSEDDTSASSLA